MTDQSTNIDASSTAQNHTTPQFRIGHGWDRHRLAPNGSGGSGRPLVIGGVLFDHAAGPVARSDGDALLHALTDALLGAIGEDDIGQLFPNTDDRNEGRDSAEFVAKAMEVVRGAGWSVGNLDGTVILERPKLAGHKDQIRKNIADLLGVSNSAVNIKGKTGEGVDAVGEGRAIEAHAVVLLTRPSSPAS